MPRRRVHREQIAAAILAPLIVGLGAFAWFNRQLERKAAEPVVALDAALVGDPDVVTGKLSNDLRYFVRANGAPEHRAELRLVVDAGSVLETPEQRGLAHAVEHMVFRGTKRFPGHAVDEYLFSVGMRPGSDVNATTSEDETVYRITVPSERIGIIDTALAILADMASAATFDSLEARQEAGVVMSEWRSRLDAGQRLRLERNAVLFAGSPYAANAVIGDTAVLRRFDLGEMRRFYSDWYHPDRMAVIAVGDFNVAEVERLIKRHFGSISRNSSAPTRPKISIPRSTTPRAAVLRDVEATGSRVALWYPRPRTPLSVRRDFRATLVEELWRAVLSERLVDAAERPGSPILDANVGAVSLVRTLSADIIGVEAARGRETAALDLVVAENARLVSHGVTPVEVRHRAHALLRSYREAEQRADRSRDIAEALIDQFLTGRPMLDRSSSYEMARDLLPTVHAEDVLARARRASIDSGAVVFVTAAAGAEEIGSPTELVSRARAISNRPPPPIPDSAQALPLVPNPPPEGKIVSERPVSDVRVFDWTLQNGMRVILKPTRFTFDDIHARILGPGGASLATDDEYSSAYFADGVIGSTGVGPFNGTKLARRLDASSVSLSASVRDDALELIGTTAPHDLDLFFQLIYSYFTAPRADTVAFRRYHERIASYARGREVDPDAVFLDSVAAITTQHHPRALRDDRRFSSSVSLSKALAFWKARTANASGFTVVFTGDFTLDRMRPLIARYLASLPGGQPEQPRDVGIRFPDGITRRRIIAGSAPRARTQLVMSGPFEGTTEASTGLGAVRDLVELVLNDRLRERLGGTYGADVSTDVTLAPPVRYKVTIDFETAPETADSLTAIGLRELDRLRGEGPTVAELEKVRAARVRDRDGDIESNTYWAAELSWHARMGWPLATIATHQADEARLSKENLRDACQRYLRTSEYVQITILPKVPVTASR
jgi:zinc protease